MNGIADKAAEWSRMFFVPGMRHCARIPSTPSIRGMETRTTLVISPVSEVSDCRCPEIFTGIQP